MGAEAIQKLLKEIDLDELAAELKQSWQVWHPVRSVSSC